VKYKANVKVQIGCIVLPKPPRDKRGGGEEKGRASRLGMLALPVTTTWKPQFLLRPQAGVTFVRGGVAAANDLPAIVDAKSKAVPPAKRAEVYHPTFLCPDEGVIVVIVVRRDGTVTHDLPAIVDVPGTAVVPAERAEVDHPTFLRP